MRLFEGAEANYGLAGNFYHCFVVVLLLFFVFEREYVKSKSLKGNPVFCVCFFVCLPSS